MDTDQYVYQSGVASGLSWSMIKTPKYGEEQCGDLHLIKQYKDKVLIAVMDGLGHGRNAAEASRRAKYLLETFSNESLINVMSYCHERLRTTRGVVMSLALVDVLERTVTWIGVGNVKGLLLPMDKGDGARSESIILRNGIVGDNLPSLQASIVPISGGDMLIFTTDGVREDYIYNVKADLSPEENVQYIASGYFKESDDSLILAAKFIGEKTDEEVK